MGELIPFCRKPNEQNNKRARYKSKVPENSGFDKKNSQCLIVLKIVNTIKNIKIYLSAKPRGGKVKKPLWRSATSLDSPQSFRGRRNNENGDRFRQIYINNNQMDRQLQFEDVDRKRNYSKIPIKKRMLLVKMVLKKGVPIAQAIQELGLKITTARFIINKYKETGTFPRRKFKKRVAKRNPLPKCKKEESQSDSASQQNENNIQRQESVEMGREVKVEQAVVKSEYSDNQPLFVYYPWYMM